MSIDLAKQLLEASGINDGQDIAALNMLILQVATYQSMMGISNDKMRKFLMILADFIELTSEQDRRTRSGT